MIGYELDPEFDFLAKIEEVKSEDILKVANKYFSKPFLSVYGDKRICSEINNLWGGIF